jgi:signal peptidase I
MAATREFRPELLAILLRDLTAEGKPVEIPVRGSSMRPWLRDGDRVRLVPMTVEEMRVGDVVVRVNTAGPVIHRFVGRWPSRQGWRLLTKGDGASRLDPPVRADELVGRVVARVRDGRAQRLEGTGMRLWGRAHAAVSLAVGLIHEAWHRTRRRPEPPGV